MNSNVELLAPAGTYEAFIAAVENGADAIYLGGKLFNARANAANFEINELAEMVKYAHLRNVKIYLTMNTLLSDKELVEALDFAYEIYKIEIDGVIVQDLGLAKILHEYLPTLPLHASTQMTIYNLAGIEELEKLGFTRAVLARELSLKEIEYICNNTDMEIEIFVHGALCVSYSGQCLMSSMIGDRSGNRGKCAQPCRLPYKLFENEKEISSGYLLSPKDLSTLELLNKFPNIKSLKIEGRMKSPEYVATVVKTYRKYLDIANNSSTYSVENEDKQNLAQVFNRGGFSTAYLENKQGKDMMCYEKPKHWGLYVGKVISYDGKRYITVSNAEKLHIGDGIEIWNKSNNSPSTIVSEIIGNKIGRITGNIRSGDLVYKTSDKELNVNAKESYSRGFKKRTNIDMQISILANTPISLTINDYTYTSNIVAETANNSAITKETIATQFSKTGNTPFSINNINIILDDNLFLPVSVLNSIRRDALEEYSNYLLKDTAKEIAKTSLAPIAYKKEVFNTQEVSLFIQKLKQEHIKITGVDNFYFTFRDAIKHLETITKFNGNKFIVLPTITKNNYDKLIKANIKQIAEKVDGFVVSNIGQLEYFKNIKTTLRANYTFNIFNSYTINLLKDYNFSHVTLSPELSAKQINELNNSQLKTEYIVYGKTCVMTSEYCPVGSIIGGLTKDNSCSKACTSNNKYFLEDRMGIKFEVIPDNIDCQSTIYNSKITSVASSELNVASIRIDIIDENLDEIQHIISTHKAGKKLSGNEYTNGHFSRPV